LIARARLAFLVVQNAIGVIREAAARREVARSGTRVHDPAATCSTNNTPHLLCTLNRRAGRPDQGTQQTPPDNQRTYRIRPLHRSSLLLANPGSAKWYNLIQKHVQAPHLVCPHVASHRLAEFVKEKIQEKKQYSIPVFR
jgi:hypothetical protein